MAALTTASGVPAVLTPLAGDFAKASEIQIVPAATLRAVVGPPKNDSDASTTTSSAKNPLVTVTSPVAASMARSLR